jgi:hypothetical protein
LKLSSHITRIISFTLIAFAAALLLPAASPAQCLSWWGSSQWFDWSDFRGAIGARYYFARLTSGTVDLSGTPLTDQNLKGSEFRLPENPDPFKEFWGILYIDRLGLRFNLEVNDFSGQPVDRPASLGTGNIGRWELKADNSRVGIDLDLIRFPFFRFGVDYDYTVNDTKFIRDEQGSQTIYQSIGPMTIGFHALTIPCRIRKIPVIGEARVRFPVPGLNRKYQAKVTDWEISGGLRPSIWETSVLGGTTFAVGLEGGYRAVDFQMNGQRIKNALVLIPGDMDLKAHWEGAFVQIEIDY